MIFLPVQIDSRCLQRARNYCDFSAYVNSFTASINAGMFFLFFCKLCSDYYTSSPNIIQALRILHKLPKQGTSSQWEGRSHQTSRTLEQLSEYCTISPTRSQTVNRMVNKNYFPNTTQAFRILHKLSNKVKSSQ